MINLKTFIFKKTKTRLEVSIDKIKKIKPSKLSIVYSSDISIYRINSICSNILNYNILLNRIINTIKEDEIVPIKTLPLDIINLSIRDFYLDKNNCYIDVIEESEKFINLTIELFSLYNNIENNKDKTFNQEKNLLTTNSVITNLLLVFEEIQICLK